MIEIPPVKDIEEARQIIQAQAEMIARLQTQSAILQEELLTATSGPKYRVMTLTEARACYLKDKLFSIKGRAMWSRDCRQFLTLEINDAFRLPVDCANIDIIDVMQKTADKFPDDVKARKHNHPGGIRKFWIIEKR